MQANGEKKKARSLLYAFRPRIYALFMHCIYAFTAGSHLFYPHSLFSANLVESRMMFNVGRDLTSINQGQQNQVSFLVLPHCV
jgi:hypothetical protein